MRCKESLSIPTIWLAGLGTGQDAVDSRYIRCGPSRCWFGSSSTHTLLNTVTSSPDRPALSSHHSRPSCILQINQPRPLSPPSCPLFLLLSPQTPSPPRAVAVYTPTNPPPVRWFTQPHLVRTLPHSTVPLFGPHSPRPLLAAKVGFSPDPLPPLFPPTVVCFAVPSLRPPHRPPPAEPSLTHPDPKWLLTAAALGRSRRIAI